MREIKLRVWMPKHLSNKCAICGTVKDHYTSGFSYFPGDLTELPMEILEDCPVQQYTGLKDINGKEIYEGDIVISENGGIFKYEVKWNSHGLWEPFVARTYGAYTPGEYYKIVGNIYENPELLDK